MLETVKGFLVENQFASAGILTVFMGALIAALRKFPQLIWRGVIRNFTVSITLYDSDELFFWLEKWVSQQSYNNRCRLLFGHSDKDEDDGYVLSPAYGQHFFFYKFRPVLLYRSKDDIDAGTSSKLKMREKISIYIISRNRSLISNILTEAKSFYLGDHKKTIKLYYPIYGCWWMKLCERFFGGDGPVLENNLYEDICSDLEKFQNSQDEYLKLGLRYKRGYLFYGPAGTGKSSIICSVAQRLKKNLCIFSLSTEITDENLVNLFAHLPHNSVIVFEDIDCLNFTSKREQEQKEEKKETVNLSTLLNVLDGPLTPNGLIVFATTNHFDKLDSALLRPGRFDRQVFVGYATRWQIETLFKRFFPNATEKDCQRFIDRWPENTSMATIEQHLVINREDIKKALN